MQVTQQNSNLLLFKKIYSTSWVRGIGFDVLCFWAGLKAGDRTESQADWMVGKVPVIVATISFGMGVDKANVR